MQKQYTGGCHCGQVRYQVDMQLESAISCNCSICSKKAHLLSFVPAEQFQLLSGADSLQEYRFNKHAIAHLFCKRCGVQSFARGEAPNGQAMCAINVRCLDDLDVSTVPLTQYDGKNL